MENKPKYVRSNPVAQFLRKTSAMFPHVMPAVLRSLVEMSCIIILASLEWFRADGALLMAMLVIVNVAFRFGQAWERVNRREVA